MMSWIERCPPKAEKTCSTRSSARPHRFESCRRAKFQALSEPLQHNLPARKHHGSTRQEGIRAANRAMFGARALVYRTRATNLPQHVCPTISSLISTTRRDRVGTRNAIHSPSSARRKDEATRCHRCAQSTASTDVRQKEGSCAGPGRNHRGRSWPPVRGTHLPEPHREFAPLDLWATLHRSRPSGKAERYCDRCSATLAG